MIARLWRWILTDPRAPKATWCNHGPDLDRACLSCRARARAAR